MSATEWRAPSNERAGGPRSQSLQARQRTLQNPRRRCRIYALGAFGAAHVVVVDHAAGDGGGAQSLVLENDGQRGQRRRAGVGGGGGELAHRLAARALGAV